jgi:hypothetical protein
MAGIGWVESPLPINLINPCRILFATELKCGGGMTLSAPMAGLRQKRA